MFFIRTFVLTAFVLICLMGGTLSDSFSAETRHFTVPIVDVYSPAQEHLSPQELWAIFTLSKTEWDDGSPITIVVYDGSQAAQRIFIQEYFGVSIPRFEEILNERAYQHTPYSPILVNTEQQMLRQVQKRGAVGFVLNSSMLKTIIEVRPIAVN